jgi:hypothetical protein
MCSIIIATFYAYRGARGKLPPKIDRLNQVASRSCHEHLQRHLLQRSVAAGDTTAIVMPPTIQVAAGVKRKRDEHVTSEFDSDASAAGKRRQIAEHVPAQVVMIDSIDMEVVTVASDSSEVAPPAIPVLQASAEDLAMRAFLLTIPVPKVDDTSPVVNPCPIEMSFDHPRYGKLTVYGENWWNDVEQPDHVRIRPAGFERYYQKTDEHQKADRFRLVDARACNFHVIRAIDPPNTPCSVFIDQWFSSYNASAVALGNCDPGWKSWTVYKHPKLTMGHVTCSTGFQNDPRIGKAFDITDVPAWMHRKRSPEGSPGTDRVRASILESVQTLRLAKDITPAPSPRVPRPTQALMHFVPYRDYFAARCRFECNEHQCSGGEMDATRFICPHGIEHEPFEAPEDELDQPMFHVPKKAAMFRPDDEADDDPDSTVASKKRRNDGGGDDDYVVPNKVKRTKLQRRHKNHVSTVWDGRIMFDRLDAIRRLSALHADVDCVLQNHMERYWRGTDRFAILNQTKTLRHVWSADEWDALMKYYCVAKNLSMVITQDRWQTITFQLRQPAAQMEVFCNQTLVRYPVALPVARACLVKQDVRLAAEQAKLEARMCRQAAMVPESQ